MAKPLSRAAFDRAQYFRELSAESRDALAAVSIEESVPKRQHLFLEGEKGHSVFILIEGSIQLLKSSPDGKEVVIRTVSRGDVFAEVVLFEQPVYPVSAVALKPSIVSRLPKAELLGLLREERFRTEFIGVLMRRMRYLADRILYLTVYDVEERLLRFLEEQQGRQSRYTLGMSKKDIAAAIGATPETFSRLILRLKNEGKLEWRGKELIVSEESWQHLD